VIAVGVSSPEPVLQAPIEIVTMAATEATVTSSERKKVFIGRLVETQQCCGIDCRPES
jgi:hypothetical protein